MIIKLAFRNFISYIRYHIPTIIMLVLGISATVILSGVFNGMKESIKDKFSQRNGGLYIIQAYSDSKLEQNITDKKFKEKIDEILSAEFSSYKDSMLMINGKAAEFPYTIVSNPDIKKGVILVEDSQAKEVLSSIFPGKEIKLIQKSDNILLADEKRIYASPEDSYTLRGAKNGIYDSLVLEFSNTPSYKRIKETISQEYKFLASEAEGNLLPHSFYNDQIILVMPDLEDGLSAELYSVLDSGYAESSIYKIDQLIKESEIVIIVSCILASFSAFIMSRIMIDHRKKEYINLRLLGGTRRRISAIMLFEELLISISCFIVSLIIIFIAKQLFSSFINLDEYARLLFSDNGIYRFSPKWSLVLFCVMICVLIPFFSVLPFLPTILKDTPLAAKNRIYGDKK